MRVAAVDCVAAVVWQLLREGACDNLSPEGS